MIERARIKPQDGPQAAFFQTPADIAIYGGAAGSGKSWGLLIEPLRHVKNPGFGAVVFRRTYPEIMQIGGLWDEANQLYPGLAARPDKTSTSWTFPSGATVKFSHLQHEKDIHKWQGAQVPLIEFDELTHFTEQQFWYLLSRNRSMCGVRPYVRASTNPDAASWVADFIDWWIGEDGYPIPSRAGVLRWFIRRGRNLVWADTQAELGANAKSLTFLPAKLADNVALERANPEYRATLEALPPIHRERLLAGNWRLVDASGEFPPEWFGPELYFPEWPNDLIARVVSLDPSKGKDSKHGDYSAIVTLGIDSDLDLWVDCRMGRWTIPRIVSEFIAVCKWFRPQLCGVEANAFQELLIERLADEACAVGMFDMPLLPIISTLNKVVRIRGRLSPLLYGRRIRYKGGSRDVNLLVSQLQEFPNGKHDDGPDALEMAVGLASDLLTGSIDIQDGLGNNLLDVIG